jgi:hypothetical protein
MQTQTHSDKKPPRDETQGMHAQSDQETGDRIDRLGDWSMAMARTALRNPAVTIPIGTLVLFAVARIPTEIFYSSFGVRPEDAGLNSVQVLLQGTATVLVLSLGVGLLYGIGFPLVNAGYYGIMKRIAQKWLGDFPPPHLRQHRIWRVFIRVTQVNRRSDRSAFQRILRLGPLIIPTFAVSFAALILTSQAIQEANSIKRGVGPEASLMPWQADRTSVLWTRSPPLVHFPGCQWLFYLGESGSRVILFDAKVDRTYRIESGAVQLVFPAACR